jgi:hypothetical protein
LTSVKKAAALRLARAAKALVLARAQGPAKVSALELGQGRAAVLGLARERVQDPVLGLVQGQAPAAEMGPVLVTAQVRGPGAAARRSSLKIRLTRKKNRRSSARRGT